jgi:hypothetical protein
VAANEPLKSAASIVTALFLKCRGLVYRELLEGRHFCSVNPATNKKRRRRKIGAAKKLNALCA